MFLTEMLYVVFTQHERGIIHRDLKAENVLFANVRAIKVADFGFSTPVDGSDGYSAEFGLALPLLLQHFVVLRRTQLQNCSVTTTTTVFLLISGRSAFSCTLWLSASCRSVLILSASLRSAFLTDRTRFLPLSLTAVVH